MAKLKDMSLDELYSRRITSAVAKVIFLKEDFTKRAPKWCELGCTLKCKNPPSNTLLVPTDKVDVLVIQDHSSLDDVKWGKSGAVIERGIENIAREIANKTLSVKGIKYGFTKLTKCQITGPDVVKGKPPTTTVLTKCAPYLHAEIRARNPRVIISLSTAVSKALGMKLTNSTNRGEIGRETVSGLLGLDGEPGIPVVLTLHPRILTMLRQNSSGAFWGPDFYEVIVRDFEKAARLLSREIPVPNRDRGIEAQRPYIRIARSIEDVQQFCAHLVSLGEQGAALSYDTETTGLDPFSKEARLITAQFGYRDPETKELKAYVFPLWHRDNIWYKSNEAWELIAPILSREDIAIIGHNIKFDLLYTYCTTGVKIQGILFDTMLMLHALNSGIQGMYGLKRAVHDWLPEMEFGGYEDKLPKLTKVKPGEEDKVEESEEEALEESDE